MAVKTALAVLAAVGLLWVLVSAGKQAGLEVSKEQRYAVPFASLEVAPPPNTTRQDFLSEVRYLSHLPETLQSVAPGTQELLTTGFKKHPWVKDVTSVTVQPDGRIKIALVYRTPAVVIQTQAEMGQLRVLDGDGVLLPLSASTNGLPRLLNPMRGIGSAGEPWPEEDARRAAELAQMPDAQTLEKKATEWIITQSNGRVLRVPILLKK